MDTPEVSWEQLLDPSVPIQYRETTAKIEAAMINAARAESLRVSQALQSKRRSKWRTKKSIRPLEVSTNAPQN